MTGATLKANGLTIFAELLRSSTRMYAHPRSLDNPRKREVIEHLVLLVRSVMDARKRVMVEINVPSAQLEELVLPRACGIRRCRPCMRARALPSRQRYQGTACPP